MRLIAMELAVQRLSYRLHNGHSFSPFALQRLAERSTRATRAA